VYVDSFPVRDTRPKGGKNMDKYEILYIIRGDIEDDLKNKTVDKFDNVVSSLGGSIDSKEVWGMKKFAYEIDKQNEGYYVLLNVTCSSDAQIEIDRLMRNDESVIRQMILKK